MRTIGVISDTHGLLREEALDALAADGMLIKRPILDTGDQVLVGFRAENYEQTLAR